MNIKTTLLPILTLVLFISCGEKQASYTVKTPTQAYRQGDSLLQTLDWPAGIQANYFAGPEITPSPACIAASPNGEVFVGVDMMGSLGKDPDKGSIVKLIDYNKDGLADTFTVFTRVDNPRGLFPVGNNLYVLHTTFSKETGKASGMDLVVFEDQNQDGIADGPSKPLIQNISSPKFLQDRGTDHSTNGIRMGIDGWIYIAVGDFGFHGALDRGGKKMTQLGGGVVRVRPDGTEMEVYTHGLRNIYDVAIDPFMNIYTRGNTNDGGGWNVRFAHHIQSGEYGYPVLFKHFTDEIIPALVDVGGGSGTGALYMDDPTWPEPFNKVPMMADWGRNQLYIHRVSADGASFKQTEEKFIELPQISDLDVDASGQVFMSAWDGAGYRGDSSKGFVVRAVPEGWSYTSFPDLKKASIDDLANLLTSDKAVARLHAQQELLLRDVQKSTEAAWEVATNRKVSLEARVAAIFTYAQIAGEGGIEKLLTLIEEELVKEFALRALTDRKSWATKVPIEPFIAALNSSSERVKIAAIIGLGRIGKKEAAQHLLQIAVPASAIAPAKDTEGLHATPNAAIIPAHLAVRSLVSLNAVEACIAAIDSDQSQLAHWALRYMHDPQVVDALIVAYNSTQSDELKPKILTTLSRIYHKEAPYDGSWWWSTRPDTHGPYYKAMEWEGTKSIKKFLKGEWQKAARTDKLIFADLNGKHRMGISEFGGEEDLIAEQNNEINLGRISNKKGQIARASIEDVMLAIADIKGDTKEGAKLFTQQGCVACHSIKKGEALKGPFMGQIGSIMSRDQIAESILKPNASISQGFASVVITAKGNKSYAGFISEETADQVVIRNIAGHVFTVKTNDILSRQELETSMMPPGLANSLSYEEFASLVTYLSEQKK